MPTVPVELAGAQLDFVEPTKFQQPIRIHVEWCVNKRIRSAVDTRQTDIGNMM